jgi:CDP-glucose 4,6-dehydratase
VTKAWGEGASWKLDGGPHPAENTFLKLDCSKAALRLGWGPKLNIATTLDWIVEWYKAYHTSRPNGNGIRAVTEAQISRFEESSV